MLAQEIRLGSQDRFSSWEGGVWGRDCFCPTTWKDDCWVSSLYSQSEIALYLGSWGRSLGTELLWACVHIRQATYRFVLRPCPIYHTPDLASFPGPAQLSVACSTEKQVMESWVGPGNETTPDPVQFIVHHLRIELLKVSFSDPVVKFSASVVKLAIGMWTRVQLLTYLVADTCLDILINVIIW